MNKEQLIEILDGYLQHALFALGVVLIAFIVHRILKFSLNRFIKRAASQLHVEPTQYHFLKNALGFVIYTAAIIIILTSIPGMRQLGATLFAGAGILAAIVGFASQAAFSNIVSGIFIVIFKPFRVGDLINIGGNYFGTVEDITLRHTVVQDLENKRYIVPNTLINSEVIHNFQIGDQRVKNLIYFGIGYSVNIDRAMDIIAEVAMAHPYFRDYRNEEEIKNKVPPIVLKVTEWADSAIMLRATVWTEDPLKGINLRFDILKTIKERFDAEGLEIPFPHRTVYHRNDSPRN